MNTPRHRSPLQQPTKDALREQLRLLAAEKIIEQGAQIERLRWWKWFTRGRK